MSYEPTVWVDGDHVTSAKLNKLEQGVNSMSYTPTVWNAGDVVTAEKLNKLEQGVAEGGGGGDFTTAEVTFVLSGFEYEVLEVLPKFSVNEQDYYTGEFQTTNDKVIVVMGQGEAIIDLGNNGVIALGESDYYVDASTVIVTGNGSYDSEENSIIITGDCTITATLTEEEPK